MFDKVCSGNSGAWNGGRVRTTWKRTGVYRRQFHRSSYQNQLCKRIPSFKPFKQRHKHWFCARNFPISILLCAGLSSNYSSQVMMNSNFLLFTCLLMEIHVLCMAVINGSFAVHIVLLDGVPRTAGRFQEKLSLKASSYSSQDLGQIFPSREVNLI